MASKFPSAAATSSKVKKAANIWEGIKGELPSIKQDKQDLQKLKEERAKKEAEAEIVRKKNAINGVDASKPKKPAVPTANGKPAPPKPAPVSVQQEEDAIVDEDPAEPDVVLKEVAKKMPKKVTIAPPAPPPPVVNHHDDDDDSMKVDEENEDDSDDSDDDAYDGEDEEEDAKRAQAAAKKSRHPPAPPAKKHTKTKPAPPAPKKRAPPSHKAAREKAMNSTMHDQSGITPAQRLHFQEVYRLNQSLQVFGQQLQATSAMLRQGNALLGLPSVADDTQQLQGFPIHGMIGWHGDNNNAAAAPSRARGGSAAPTRRLPNKDDDREFAKNVLTTETATMTPEQVDEFIARINELVAKKIKAIDAALPVAKRAKKISENIGGFYHNNGTTLGRYPDKTANLLVTLAAYIRTAYPAAAEKAKYSGTSRADVLTRIVRTTKETLMDATPLGALAEKGPIPETFIDAFANVIAYYELFLAECGIEVVHVAPVAGGAADGGEEEEEEEEAKE